MERLSPAQLSQLSGVKLRARRVVEGALSGLHKSPHQGQSVEFSEHKEYTPGDELRHLDWKAFGKFDRYYVKRFEHETNARAVMAVDASGSMAYGSGPLSKLDVACTLAGALSQVLVRQQDAAGLSVLSANRITLVPPRASPSHLEALFQSLDSLRPDGGTKLRDLASHLVEQVPRRAMVFLFSDFFDDDGEALTQLLALRARKHDLVFFHLVDKFELTFPFEDPTLFTSLEDDRRLEVNPRLIRDSFLEEFGKFLEQTRSRCLEADVEYIRVQTDDALDDVLLRFLERRQGGRR